MARTCDALLCSSENESMHKWLTFCVDTLKLKADSKRKELERLLTIIPRARMGSESIAHEAEGRMSYSIRGREGERNNCFSKIQLVGPKNIETKHLS